MSRVIFITLNDDINEVENKLKINSKSRVFKDYLFGVLDKVLLPELSSLNDSITPYQVPSFDADGERAGHAISHYVDNLSIKFEITLPTPRLELSSLWDRLANAFDSILIFSDAAKRRKQQRVIDLQNGIHDQLVKSWDSFLQEVEENISRETDVQYENLLNSIHSVMDKITSDAGGTLPQTINKIEDALSGVAMPNVFISKILHTFKHKYG